jgi:hypothetical protein
MQKQDQQLSSIPLPPAINFKTAFEEFRSKDQLLTCGIEKIDSILNLTAGDRLTVIGNKKYFLQDCVLMRYYRRHLQKRTIVNW